MKPNKGRIQIAKKIIEDVMDIPSIFKEYRRFDNPAWRGDGEYIISCPFHSDSTPSLSIKKKMWKCFGCGKGGGAVSAFINLSYAVDYTYYDEAHAIEQMIKRYPRVADSVSFSSVFDDTLDILDVLSRPRLKYKPEDRPEKPTMFDVYNLMKKLDRTSFIDVAYVSSMMVANQEPFQIMQFLGLSFENNKLPTTTLQTVTESAEDLLSEANWDD